LFKSKHVREARLELAASTLEGLHSTN